MPRSNYSATIHPEAFHMLPALLTVRLMNLGIRELPEYMFKNSLELRHMSVSSLLLQSYQYCMSMTAWYQKNKLGFL